MRILRYLPLVSIACSLSKDSGYDNGGGGLTENGCYDGGQSCTVVEWSDVKNVIDALYTFTSEYAGYSQTEATDLARSLYDDGVVPGAWMRVIRSEDHGDGTWTVWVAMADDDGRARTDVTADAFTVDEGDASGAVTSLTRLNELSGDASLRVSVVLDDSGSVTDCDASGVAAGLASLFQSLPPIWEAHLVKFDEEVFVLSEGTRDADELTRLIDDVCTDRGGTAVWDAGLTGLSALPGTADLELQILFTDGLDNASVVSARDYRNAAMDAGIPVYVAALGIPDIFELYRLAQRTGGGLMYVKNGQDVGQVFDTLSGYVGNAMKLEVQASAGATFTLSADGVSATVGE